jgi:hypothetical protein
MEQKEPVKKHRGGRPKKSIKNDQVLHVKCTLLDKTTIQGKARIAGYTVSRFMREIALKGKIDRKDKTFPKEVLKFEALINNIGSNLNQIAKKLNSTGQLSPFWAKQLEFHLDELEIIKEKINSYFQ